MKIFIAIDDTDNLEEGATGQTANKLRDIIENRGWGTCKAVTRHQLLLHPDVPYTSHNSSMCFASDIEARYLSTLIDTAGDFLHYESAVGSDPGLCVLVEKNITDASEVVAFGYKAKQVIVYKEEAYELARQLGIHLSEHGGTGEGIIGALAGVGLRMAGNDGRFQGRIEFENSPEIMCVHDIKALSEIEEVKSLDGLIIPESEYVLLGDKIKTVLLQGKRTLLVYQDDAKWRTCNKQQLRVY